MRQQPPKGCSFCFNLRRWFHKGLSFRAKEVAHGQILVPTIAYNENNHAPCRRILSDLQRRAACAVVQPLSALVVGRKASVAEATGTKAQTTRLGIDAAPPRQETSKGRNGGDGEKGAGSESPKREESERPVIGTRALAPQCLVG